jgi:hypothetical protein
MTSIIHCPLSAVGVNSGGENCPKLALVLSQAICVILLVLVASKASAQSNYNPTLIIDPEALDDASRAAVVRALARIQVSQQERLATTKLRPGSNLYELVNEKYRYYDSKSPMTATAIAEAIKDLNGLKSIELVPANEDLVLPTLPVRPYKRNAQPSQNVQLVDLAATAVPSRVALAPIYSLSATMKSPPIPTAASDLPDAAAWAINLTSNQLEIFTASLPAALKGRGAKTYSYLGPKHDDFVMLSIPAGKQIPSAGAASDESLTPPSPFADLTGGDVGKYYVVDYFQGDCPHGKKVLDVARLTVAQYAGGRLTENVLPIEVDFYADQANARQLISRYIGSFPSPNVRRQLQMLLDSIRTRRPDGASIRVPVLYLQAIYASLIELPDTSIVSSSFYVTFDGTAFLPSEYVRESPVLLLSAVLDDPGYVEDANVTEPIRTYWDRRRDYGLVLVGAEVAAGTPLGMTSRDGDGVTTLGRAHGWETPTSCIKQSDAGTSYATPSIGARLFLARGLWNSAGVKVSSMEAKVRLLLAGQLLPDYVGQYASAGRPALDRLARLRGSYAITTTAAVAEIAAVQGFIDVKAATSTGVERFFLGRGLARFAGLHLGSSGAFIFREALMRWEKVEVAGLSLQGIRDGQPFKLTSTADFIQQFTTLVKISEE